MKKLVLIIMTVACILMLFACKSDTPSQDGSKDPQESENSQDSQEETPEYYSVTFDANGSDASNLPAVQKVKAGEYVSAFEIPTRDGYYFCGWHTSANAVAFINDPIAFEEYPITEDVVFYAIWESAKNDFDGDGLNYDEENSNDTDPLLYDTDSDGLSDGNEVNVHNTDPTNADSDRDGISDGVEISLGLNPLKAKSDGVTDDAKRELEAQIKDGDEEFSLTVNADPLFISSVSTATFDLSCLESSEGLVSPIIDVSYNESMAFNYANLTYNYSSADLKGIDENDLTFLYLNEESGLLELVPSDVDIATKNVSVKATHFSSYVVGARTASSSSFKYSNASKICYEDEIIPVEKVAVTGFDIKKHAFAFRNFRHSGVDNDGFCYGFTFTAYLNYIERLPIVGKKYSNRNLDHPGYDISKEDRFFNDQLYDPQETNLFNKKNNYDVTKVAFSETLSCIMYWYGKQHNIRDNFFDNLENASDFVKLKEKLLKDEPVPLSISRIEGIKKFGHSVLAYGLYRSADDPKVFFISVYDSNFPGKMQYIKATVGNSLSNSVYLEYIVRGSAKEIKYTTFRIANLTLPDEGPFVKHYSEGLQFVSNGDGTCYVSGIGSCTDTRVVIPKSSPDGDHVIGIGESAFKNREIIGVVIPEGVLTVGDHAFYACTKLSTVAIPQSLISIGNYASYGCKNITDVYYAGNETDGAKIVVGYGNEARESLKYHYNFSY